VHTFERYLFKDAIASAVSIMLVLFGILLVVRFATFLGDAATGKLPARFVVTLMVYGSLELLSILLPISMFLGIMLTLGRLYFTSEMIAATACGFGSRAVYVPALCSGLLVAMLAGICATQLTPWSALKINLLRQQGASLVQAEVLPQGEFRYLEDGITVIYMEDVIDKDQLTNIFASSLVNGKRVILTAHAGRFFSDETEAGRYLILNDGWRYQGQTHSLDSQIITFGEHRLHFQLEHEVKTSQRRKLRATRTLWGTGDSRDQAELINRLSAPIIAMLLAALAPSIARTAPRSGRYNNLLPAIAVYLVYTNLINAASSYIEENPLRGIISVFVIHGSMLLYILSSSGCIPALKRRFSP